MGEFQPYFFCYDIKSHDFMSKLFEFILNITKDNRIPDRDKIKAKLLEKMNDILEEDEKRKKKMEEAAAKAAATKKKEEKIAAQKDEKDEEVRLKKIQEDKEAAETAAALEAERVATAAEKRAAEKLATKADTTGKLIEDGILWDNIKDGLENTKSHYYKLLEQYKIIPEIYLPVYMTRGYVGLKFDDDNLLALNESILESFKNNLESNGDILKDFKDKVIASGEVPVEFDRDKLLRGLTIGINKLKIKYGYLSDEVKTSNQNNLENATKRDKMVKNYWKHRAEAEAFAIAPESLIVNGLSEEFRFFRIDKSKPKVNGAAHYSNTKGKHLSSQKTGYSRFWKFTDSDGALRAWHKGTNNVPLGKKNWKISKNGVLQYTVLELTVPNDLDARFARPHAGSGGGRSNIITKRKSQKTKNNKHYKSTHKKTVNKNKESKTLRKKKRR